MVFEPGRPGGFRLGIGHLRSQFRLADFRPHPGCIGFRLECGGIPRRQFLEAGWATAAEFDRVYAPIGLDLGGNSPNEIAVGILAEIVACRQKKGIRERNVKTRRLN